MQHPNGSRSALLHRAALTHHVSCSIAIKETDEVSHVQTNFEANKATNYKETNCKANSGCFGISNQASDQSTDSSIAGVSYLPAHVLSYTLSYVSADFAANS